MTPELPVLSKHTGDHHDDMIDNHINDDRIEHEVSTGRRSSIGQQIRVEQGRESSHFLQ